VSETKMYQQPVGHSSSLPVQKTAKHRAEFSWLPTSDVAAVTKPRRETR